MNKPKITNAEKLKFLEVTLAYAQYKTRHAGDLDTDLTHWANNIMCMIKSRKARSKH